MHRNVSRLEDISLSRRFGLAIAVVLGLALGVAAPDYFVEAQILEPQLYEGIPLDSTLLHLDKQALEDAYHQYLLLLFSVWLKGDVGEDQRIKAGLKKARAAYNSAARQIAEREQELLKHDRTQQNRMP